MRPLHQSFTVSFQYPVLFTENIFAPDNLTLRDALATPSPATDRKLLFVVDDGVANATPGLLDQMLAYCATHVATMPAAPLVLPGGEACKNDPHAVERILSAINAHGIDRHSYVVGVGGGALLDVVGYASAIAHRGVRHVRLPTTVLSQNDSGVGVKNSVNYFDKKNFLGTFTPPIAVINDAAFLRTLDDRDWRAGISEAIKVALIKDAAFFDFLEAQADALNQREMATMQPLIHRCAELHMAHIASRDPFELGSSRPLDFGHWAAHKLEQLSGYRVRHGEAVAMGMALDATYSMLSGLLAEGDWQRIMQLIAGLGFELHAPEMALPCRHGSSVPRLLDGLTEFKEHLGGQLTIMLLRGIGQGEEVHHIDHDRMATAIRALEAWQMPVSS